MNLFFHDKPDREKSYDSYPACNERDINTGYGESNHHRSSIVWRVISGIEVFDDKFTHILTFSLYSESLLLYIHKIQQIQPARRIPPLAQQQRHFAAMLGGMVDLMNHLLPQWVGPALILEITIPNNAREISLTASGDKILRLAFNLIPAGAEGIESGKACGSNIADGELPCQRASQSHCALMMWSSVPCTEPKLAPASARNCSGLS